MSLVTIGRSQDIDLAIPPLIPGKPSGQNLHQIADGYSEWVTREWVRAVNVEYRAGASGPSVSVLAEGGTIWATGDPRWPVMIATKTGIIIKEKPSIKELKEARWAFSAGPWLIREGKSLDISTEIKFGGFSGLDEASRRERAAIGIREDGVIVHIADMSMTLWQIREALLEKGCREAIGLDGGGSLGVLDPEGNILIGYLVRQVCCALIFKRLLEETPSPTPFIPPQPPEPSGKMIVCIDAGHGGIDPGGVGPDGSLEKTVNLYVAKLVAEYLTRAGVKVILTRDSDRAIISGPGGAKKEEVIARAGIANINKSIYCVSIHANTVTDPEVHGYEVFHWPGSVKGKRLAESISRAYGIATGMHLRRVDPAEYWILDYTHMPATLIELGFLTNTGDRTRLKELPFLHTASLGIAFGILET